MKEENLAIANVGEPNVRMTRARAAACHAFGGIPPSEALKQQGQKQVLRTSSKRAALDEMNSSASAATPVQHKRRAVLKDVTNVCCENSYKNCLIAAKIPKKNSKQANKGSVNVSKVMHLDAEKEMMSQCVALLGKFIAVREPNIQYLGLEIRMLMVSDVQDIIKRYQSQIITSLKDPDIRCPEDLGIKLEGPRFEDFTSSCFFFAAQQSPENPNWFQVVYNLNSKPSSLILCSSFSFLCPILLLDLFTRLKLKDLQFMDFNLNVPELSFSISPYVNAYENLLILVGYPVDDIMKRSSVKMSEDDIFAIAVKKQWRSVSEIEKKLPAEAIAWARRIARYRAVLSTKPSSTDGIQTSEDYRFYAISTGFSEFSIKDKTSN
ncbi:hypothetical protein TEA_024470 [Camellia sinensis var. sinensis]|uniref:Uncharacterized protein n=1 Tax=Camellia sinensis var. sinensis TaxID=542762 RepID=A0A4S4DMJ9_CAMSN|nr:hypothetical protein TEA_024470 [Camellia sinensis var. sinensis]